MMMLTLILRMIADTVGEGAGRKIVVEKSTVPVKIQTYKKIPIDIKTKHTTNQVKAAESISNILRHNIKPGVAYQVNTHARGGPVGGVERRKT